MFKAADHLRSELFCHLQHNDHHTQEFIWKMVLKEGFT